MYRTRRLMAVATSVMLAATVAYPANAVQLEHPQGQECRFVASPGEFEKYFKLGDSTPKVVEFYDALAADYGYDRAKLNILSQVPPVATPEEIAEKWGESYAEEVFKPERVKPISPTFKDKQEQAGEQFLKFVAEKAPRDAELLAPFVPSKGYWNGYTRSSLQVSADNIARYDEQEYLGAVRHLMFGQAPQDDSSLAEKIKPEVELLPTRTADALVAIAAQRDKALKVWWSNAPVLKKAWRENNCNSLGVDKSNPVTVDLTFTDGYAPGIEPRLRDHTTPQGDEGSAESSAEPFAFGLLGGVMGAVAVLAALVGAVAQFAPQLADAVMAVLPRP